MQRRHAHGSTVLRGKVVSRRDRTGISRQVVDRRAAWLELVADEFRLPLAALGVDPAAIDRLWRHVSELPVPDDLEPFTPIHPVNEHRHDLED